jgi:hypothetical protein
VTVEELESELAARARALTHAQETATGYLLELRALRSENAELRETAAALELALRIAAQSKTRKSRKP